MMEDRWFDLDRKRLVGQKRRSMSGICAKPKKLRRLESPTSTMCRAFSVPNFMSKEFAAKHRKTAAKLNYLALDNPLTAFASEEASRSMSSPRQGEEVKMKRILRFLRKRPTTT